MRRPALRPTGFEQLGTFGRSYRALVDQAWSLMLQYRASVFLWTLWSLAGPLIHLSVWRSIVAANGSLGGYGEADIVAYFIVQSIVYHFTVAWQVHEFGFFIRTGRLSFHLLRPLDPSHHIIAANAAFKVINLVWLIPIWAGMFLYFKPEISFEIGRVVSFAVALLLASILNFLWVHCWAMLAFWTIRANSFYELFDAVAFLFGGGIAPVALLPGLLQAGSRYLPFYSMVGWPIEVAVSRAGASTFYGHLWITCLWIAVLFAVYRALWIRGLRRYGAVGA